MWRCTICRVASLICAVAGLASVSPVAAQGTPDITPKTSEATGAPDGQKFKLYGASKALVIGIDNYAGSGWFAADHWPKLSKAIEDAGEVAKALERQGFAVTLRKDLTSDELKREMEAFFIKEGADPQSRLLVWFAGHGHTIGGEGYLVPADAPVPKDSDIEFRAKAFSLRQFGYLMREAHAKHVLAVLDSCFAGTVFNVARALPPRAVTLATNLPVRQFVSSGDAGQTVSDNGRFRRLFVGALDGTEPDADLNKDGYIMGTELGLFLADKVTNYSEKGQTPRYGKLNAEGYDSGDFVLVPGKLAAPPASAAGPAVSDTPGQTPGSPDSSSSKGLDTGAAERAWALVQSSDDIAVLEAYRRQFGSGNAFYDSLAASRIAKLSVVVAEAERKAGEDAASGAKRAPNEANITDTDQTRVNKANSAQLQHRKDRKAEAEAKREADEAAEAKRKEEQRLAMLAEEEKKRKETDGLTKPGRVFRDCEDVCPWMVVVSSGEFTMGSPANEEGHESDEGPQRTVKITKPFAVGKFEVTRDQFEAFVNASGFKGADECYVWTGSEWKKQSGSFRKPGFDQTGAHPAVCVSWDDAKAYAAWLSQKSGKSYRLLTEAEWEYSTRAITEAKPLPRYYFGNDAKELCGFANGADQSAKAKFSGWTVSDCKDGYVFTAPAGSFKPNAFGLYDMHGNVWEWVEDCYQDSYNGAPQDGTARTSADCSRRVLRGGSWYYDPRSLRSANRNRVTTDNRSNLIGFRVGRTLD